MRVDLSRRQLRRRRLRYPVPHLPCLPCRHRPMTPTTLPLPPAHPTSKADESTPRDYDLPARSQMAIPKDYKLDDEDDYNKVEGGSGVDCPSSPIRLAQNGTLNPSVVGRTKRPLSNIFCTIYTNLPY